ncbi:MAG: hypothetical protein ACI3VM_09190 [Oscillospiraceae bacterium]
MAAPKIRPCPYSPCCFDCPCPDCKVSVNVAPRVNRLATDGTVEHRNRPKKSPD